MDIHNPQFHTTNGGHLSTPPQLQYRRGRLDFPDCAKTANVPSSIAVSPRGVWWRLVASRGVSWRLVASRGVSWRRDASWRRGAVAP